MHVYGNGSSAVDGCELAWLGASAYGLSCASVLRLCTDAPSLAGGSSWALPALTEACGRVG